MSDTISLTIPADNETALVSGAMMLLTLAGKLPTPDLDDIAGEGASSAGANGPASSGEGASSAGSQANDVETDADGLPWDSRIHSGSKKMNADGRWKKKKGVGDQLREQVEAELRAVMSAGTGANDGDVTEQVAEFPPAPDPQTAPAAPAPDPQTAPAAPAPDPEPAGEMDWPTFLRNVSGAVNGGQITMERVNEILAQPDIGLPNMNMLGNRPDLIPTVWQRIAAESNGAG